MHGISSFFTFQLSARGTCTNLSTDQKAKEAIMPLSAGKLQA